MEKETIYQETKFYFLLIPNLTKLYNLMMFTTLISGSKIRNFLKTTPKLAFLLVSQFLARYSYPAKSVVMARFWAGLAYLQNNFPPSSFGRGLAGLCVFRNRSQVSFPPLACDHQTRPPLSDCQSEALQPSQFHHHHCSMLMNATSWKIASIWTFSFATPMGRCIFIAMLIQFNIHH